MTWESVERRTRGGTQNLNSDGAGTPGIWDVVYIAGQPCPGVAEVNLKLGTMLDRRQKKGQKKSRPLDCGAKPSEANITITLHAGQFEEFSAKFAALLFAPAKTSAQNPINIGHPSLEVWNLDLFTIQDLEQPHPSKGLMKISFKAVEWSPEPKSISSKQKVQAAREVLDTAIVGLIKEGNKVRTFVDKLF
jgi:hypothetical protein